MVGGFRSFTSPEMSESEHIRGVRRSKTLQRQQFSRFSGDILVGQNRSGVISDVLSVGRQVCREEQQGFKGGKRQFGGGGRAPMAVFRRGEQLMWIRTRIQSSHALSLATDECSPGGLTERFSSAPTRPGGGSPGTTVSSPGSERSNEGRSRQ